MNLTDELVDEHIRFFSTKIRNKALGRDRHYNQYWWFETNFEPAARGLSTIESYGIDAIDETLREIRRRKRKEPKGLSWGDGRLWVELVDGEYGECIGWGYYETSEEVSN